MDALAGRFGLQVRSWSRVPTGLINRTYRLEAEDGRRYALQALSPIFRPEVNLDIQAVTAHLAAAGLATPRLLEADDGRPWVELDGTPWRVMDWLDGRSHDRVRSPEHAAEAGALLARFHRGLADYDTPFRARRLGVHDTPKHLAALRAAVERHAEHPLASEVGPLARAILEAADRLPVPPDTPERVVHGDPKISNLLFDDRGRGLALVDLDTVGPMALPLELGDALRSWCNTSTAGEDDAEPGFSRALFDAAVQGYADGASGGLSADERDAIAPTAIRIMVELAARFAADALEERYFGWDPGRFARRGEHALLRARGQLALAAAAEAELDALRASVTRAFGRAKEDAR